MNTPCADGVVRQSCVLVTMETVTLSIEQTPSFRLRMNDSLICAETALRNGMAQANEF